MKSIARPTKILLPIVLLLVVAATVPYGAVAHDPTDQTVAEADTKYSLTVNNSTTTSDKPSITDVRHANAGTVTSVNGTQYLWPSESHTLNVTIQLPDDGNYRLCLDIGPMSEAAQCQYANSTGGSVLSFSDVRSENETGAQSFTFILMNASTGDVVDTSSVQLSHITRTGDLDDDGLSNAKELGLGTRIDDGDTDGDGLPDGAEVNRHGTSPTDADTDGDGVNDSTEVEGASSPLDPDTDDDGVSDDVELASDSNVTKADTDGDGLPDDVERASDSEVDNPDTDGDGIPDGVEAEMATNVTNPDTDGDGLPDGRERHIETDATDPDTDGDGLSDGEEMTGSTSPTDPDTDGDGLADGKELELGTDPTQRDTDGDGLSDGQEAQMGTSPTTADTDGDGLDDRSEASLNLNPTDPFTVLWVLGIGVGFVMGVGCTFVAIQRGWFVEQTVDTEEAGGPVTNQVAALEATLGDEPPESVDADDRTAEDVFRQSNEEMLTPREVVQHMLEAENGRMRQGTIVDASDWSKAKVSRLLSKMEDDEDIVKIQIGRENLICLEGREPEIVGADDWRDSASERQPTPSTSNG